MDKISKDLQYYKFCAYGFFKNLRFFDAFLVLFFLDKGLNYGSIGLLYAVREIIVMLTEIPSGLVADTWGRRRTLAGSFLFYMVSFIAFFFAPGLGMFMAAMVLFAIGDAFRTGVHKAMIFQYLKHHGWEAQRVSYYGHTRSWSQIGSALSALLAAMMVFYGGSYRMIFLWSIIPYMADTALVLSYPSWLDGAVSKDNRPTLKKRFTAVWTGLSESIRNRDTLRALVSTSIFSGYYAAIKDYIQPMIKSLAVGIPVWMALDTEKRVAIWIGLIYFVLFWLTSFASRWSGNITRRMGSMTKGMNITLVVGLLSGVLALAVALPGSTGWPIAGFVLIMMIENLRKPLGIAMVAELSKEEAMASVLSVTSQAKSIFAALLALTTGYMAQWWGLTNAIALLSLLLLLMFPLYRLSNRHNS